MKTNNQNYNYEFKIKTSKINRRLIELKVNKHFD